MYVYVTQDQNWKENDSSWRRTFWFPKNLHLAADVRQWPNKDDMGTVLRQLDLWLHKNIPEKTAAHYNNVIMGTIASQITSLTIVYSIVYSDADQRKLQSSASLAFMRGIHRSPVNSPHMWPVTRKMFPFDDVIMDSKDPRIMAARHQSTRTCRIDV